MSPLLFIPSSSFPVSVPLCLSPSVSPLILSFHCLSPYVLPLSLFSARHSPFVFVLLCMLLLLQCGDKIDILVYKLWNDELKVVFIFNITLHKTLAFSPLPSSFGRRN
jgi:hypothetical protein